MIEESTWTLEAYGARPLTTNRLVALHRMSWAAHTRKTRALWMHLARNVPQITAASFDVTPLHKDFRSPQDVAACAPEAKAAIDGIVDAGVIPDDSPVFLHSVTFYAPDVCGMDGLRITIKEKK